jgi:2-polyprenyl-3-methyl-5-hydroxy-6-metoxy-1,4-benzoquinol methylase
MDQGHPLQPKDWRSSTHEDRFARVRGYFVERSVLDVGAATGADRADWVHALIAGVANDTIGIDLDQRLVDRARAKGFDVVVADAQTFSLDRSFDVVFAGELIEHLSCCGDFLDRAREHLEPDGLLVLTTPNVFSVSNFVYRVGGRPRVNKGHTCWFDEVTLGQLLERHGYQVLEVDYIRHRTPGRVRALVARGVRSMLPHHLAENTLLVVATPKI